MRLAKTAGMNLLYLLAFCVVLVIAGVFMVYGLPLLATWYGWVGATVIILALVTAFDLDW